MDNIRELSTHVQRQDRRMPDPLEGYLEDWGYWRRMGGILEIPHKTSLKIAEELRPEQLQDKIPKLYYIDNKGRQRAYPDWYCRLVHELQVMWRKGAQTSTRVVKGQTPRYMPRPKMAHINQAIGLLEPLHYAIIVMRYEQEWDAKTCQKEIGLPICTYYDRLKKAKKNLSKILNTR